MVIRHSTLWSLVSCSEKGGKGDLWLSDKLHSGLLFHVQRKEARVTYGYQTNYNLVSLFYVQIKEPSVIYGYQAFNTLVSCFMLRERMDELGFYVPSTVFQSFRDNGRVNMKSSVQ